MRAQSHAALPRACALCPQNRVIRQLQATMQTRCLRKNTDICDFAEIDLWGISNSFSPSPPKRNVSFYFSGGPCTIRLHNWVWAGVCGYENEGWIWITLILKHMAATFNVPACIIPSARFDGKAEICLQFHISQSTMLQLVAHRKWNFLFIFRAEWTTWEIFTTSSAVSIKICIDRRFHKSTFSVDNDVKACTTNEILEKLYTPLEILWFMIRQYASQRDWERAYGDLQASQCQSRAVEATVCPLHVSFSQKYLALGTFASSWVFFRNRYPFCFYWK